MPPKRVITVESKVIAVENEVKPSGKERKKPLQLPSVASVGQPCLKCQNKCTGGYVPHSWKKECVDCGCTRDSHQSSSDYGDLPYLKDMLLEDISPLDDKKKLDTKYAWYPSGIDYEMVEKYMECLPRNCVPFKGSKAEQQRKDRLSYQHPSHDSNVEYCHEMPELEKKRMKKFGERRMSCFGMGKVSMAAPQNSKCHGCSEVILQASVFVTAREKMWHPQCFRCSTCMELLADLYYFYSDKGEIYCGRHHGETIVPRCQGCDEMIFSGTYTEAKGKKWHKSHFCCSMCEMELHGKKNFEVSEAIYCEQCYTREFAAKCHECNQKIAQGTKVTVSKYSWHADCFTCRRCKENLLKQKYYLSDESLLCSKCKSDHSIVTQCQGCKNAISSTVSFIKHKKLCWHAECFKCMFCQTWLADGKFHEIDGNPACTSCYTSKIGTKCAICQQTISTAGVKFGLRVYHADCFKCRACDKMLIRESKVKEKNGEPICSDCYLKQVSKKCYRCKGPIVSRHTVYKGHPFHIECFKCNICGLAIDNATFFETSLNEILCEKCAN